MYKNISESCFLDIPSPNYGHVQFDFEKNFDHWRTLYWFANNLKLGLYITGFYLVAIFTGQHLMKSRTPFQLRWPLFFWNLGLSLMSIVALIRLIPDFKFGLEEHGFYGTLCEKAATQRRKTLGFWVTVFALLKVVELGDTFFIVLRKTPLIFLHWYHHVSVLLFTWASGIFPSAMQPYFYLANLTMHAFVYSYYALKVLRVKIPRKVNIVITLMQILEMAFGIFIVYSAYREKTNNPDCCNYDQAMIIAAVVYFLYFILFTNFFIKSYISNKGALFDERGAIKKIA